MSLRSISAILAALFLAIGMGAASAEEKFPLQFDADKFDFGDIDEADGIVSHTFVFSNISNETVTIEFVSTSCGCTTTTYPTDPIPPEQICEFTVHFNPARTEGKVYRDIEVFVQGFKQCQYISLEATVHPAPVGVRQMYPHVLGGNVRTAFSNIAFGYLAQGQKLQKSAVIVNDSDKPVKLRTSISTKTGILSVDCPSELEPNQAKSVVFNFDLTGTRKYGTEIDTVWIWTDGKRGDVPFIVSTICTDDFSDTSKPQPKLALEPTYYDFGQQKAGRILKQKFVISNDGEADLIIRAVEHSEGATSDLKAGTVIPRGQNVVMTAATTVRGNSGHKAAASVNLITNDPVRPRREIRMTVETK